MSILPLRVTTAQWLLPAIAALAALAPCRSVSAAEPQKKVLVLYSTNRDAQVAIVGERELPRLLNRGLPRGVDYYSEFIDLSRYSGGESVAAFRGFLKLKYEGHAFDVVIAMDHRVLEFLEKARADLFPVTPVVFFTSRALAQRPAGSTGVRTELNLRETLSLAAVLQPSIRNVFVVSGADRTYETVARAQFRPLESRFFFTYLSDLPTEELESRLRALPPQSIVYYLHVARDGAGENFNTLEYLQRIAAVANAPTYSWVDSAMDRGIVGGVLRSLTGQMDAVANAALRVLRGEPADSIPITTPDLNVRQVDWRQLRRWGISEARVPTGTVIRFKEPTAWNRYRVYIVGAVVLLLAQTALIAGLLVQRSRRRRAEDQVRGGQDALRASDERIRDLGSRLLRAQDTERTRIARELHDDIGQQLAILAVDLELLNGAVRPGQEELVGETVHRAQSIAKGVHDLSRRLHPAKLRLVGLVGALHALQRELSRPGMEISFTHDNVPSIVPPDLTLCLYRVVQEALQNALKYSRAHGVSVDLRGESEALRLTVVDDGVGFDVESAWGRGLGLISMRERLEAAGGIFEIRSNPGAGTRLDVRVPLCADPSAQVAAG
jgi:signal transduction histidine kinase